jgi:hypothetical protein
MVNILLEIAYIGMSIRVCCQRDFDHDIDEPTLGTYSPSQRDVDH